MTRLFLPLLVLAGCGGPAADALPPTASEASPAPAPEAPPAPEPPPPPTAETWKTHPDIVAIRALVEGIQEPADREAWTETTHDYTELGPGCEAEEVYKIGLARLAEGGPLARYERVEGRGDVARETLIFYGTDGKAQFLMSTYMHASAESSYLRRAYFKDGTLLYEPEVEQLTENSGPGDETPIEDLAVLTAAAAEQAFQATATKCAGARGG